jgi:hypothetical protein
LAFGYYDLFCSIGTYWYLFVVFHRRWCSIALGFVVFIQVYPKQYVVNN